MATVRLALSVVFSSILIANEEAKPPLVAVMPEVLVPDVRLRVSG